MTVIDIKSKVHELLVSTLKHDNFELQDETTANDIEGWDSLTHMLIIDNVETEFDIKFRLRDLNKLKNIGSLVALIQSKL